jgi:hypothetical protein
VNRTDPTIWSAVVVLLLVTWTQASAREIITYSLKTDKTEITPGDFVKVELWATFDPHVGEPTTYKGQPAKVVSFATGSGHIQNFEREALWLPFQPAPFLKTDTGGSSTSFGLMGVTVYQTTPTVTDDPILLGSAFCKPLGTEAGNISFQFVIPPSFQSGMTVFVLPTLSFAALEWDKTSTAAINVQIVPVPGTIAGVGVGVLLYSRRRR